MNHTEEVEHIVDCNDLEGHTDMERIYSYKDFDEDSVDGETNDGSMELVKVERVRRCCTVPECGYITG